MEAVLVTPGPRLLSAAWCVALRMLDVVAEFSSRGEWRHDLINKWKEAFQMLEAVGEGQPCQLCTSHLGITCSCLVLHTGCSFPCLYCHCMIDQPHPADEPGMTGDER